MPQMAPYNWLMLFLLFNSMMIFLNSFNHYMKIPKMINKLNYETNSYIWKW